MRASWHLGGAHAKESKTNAMPPLTWMELSKKHIPCCCEALIDGLVTQMIGTYITEGWAGFLGDMLNDWSFKPTGARPENVMVIGHCGAPITPHGDDRIPYTIRDHVVNKNAAFRLFGPEDTITATTVDWPSGEAATIVKFDIYRKRVTVLTGTVLDGDALYKDFSDTICRNKIVVQIDNPEDCFMLPSDPKEGVFRRSRVETFGHYNHQVVFYGNHRKKIKNFANLIGFEVIEKDR